MRKFEFAGATIACVILTVGSLWFQSIQVNHRLSKILRDAKISRQELKTNL